MIYGSEPREGGYLILSEADKQELIEESPFLDIYIKRFVSAADYINDKYRYCLWLVDADLSKIRTSKIVMNRLESVKEFRLNSKQIKKIALMNSQLDQECQLQHILHFLTFIIRQLVWQVKAHKDLSVKKSQQGKHQIEHLIF